MHPAPMPINRFGRPFAPITTLKEFLPPEEINDVFANNLAFGPEISGSGTNFADTSREGASGRNANTMLDESFETKSPSATLIDGLRIGSPAKSRINFGGLTKAGIPGWAPDAGKWGFGRDGDNIRYNRIYGNPANATTTMLSSTLFDSNILGDGYIPSDEVRNDNVGDSELYGIRFVDHRGGTHTIRIVYRQFGEKFANDLTTLPPTIDDEIIIHFDDRDVGQGGFTVGKHMVGQGEVCGELTGGTLKDYKGNLWNTYPSPVSGIHVSSANIASGTMTLVFTAPYEPATGTISHSDILGYLGFPESGVFQLSTTGGVQGLTFYYTGRTHNGKAGPHKFYGLVGGATSHADDTPYYISPRVNFTSVLTDEVRAAAVDMAIKWDDAS